MDAAAAIEAADKALEAGDLQGAAEIYAAVLQEDPQNVAALAGLARCYLKSGDVGARRADASAWCRPTSARPAAVASVRAALDLAQAGRQGRRRRQARGQGRGRARQPSGPHRLAMALAAGGKKAEALDQLLESFRRDRKWNEEAARKQLVQLFDAWGPKDPGHARRPPPPVVDPVLLNAYKRVHVCRPSPSAIADPRTCRSASPCFPCARAILLPRAACRSTCSSRAIWRCSTT